MRLKKPKKNFEKLTPSKARIIAHLIADGSLSRSKYSLRYEVKDLESLKQFDSDLMEVYGLKGWWHNNKSGFTGSSIEYVHLRSKIAYYDLLRYASYFSYTWKINDELMNASKKIKKQFLRAFYDDEGSIIRKLKIIRLYSVNEKGLFQIQLMLNEFGINTYIVKGFGAKRNVWALTTKDLKTFQKKINFGLERKIVNL